MRSIEGAGVELAVAVSGAGPPVVVIHDMASSAAAVEPLRAALAAAGATAVTYDRRGYGGSGAPDPYTATTIHEQAEDAAAVLRSADPPAVVAGLGFGALVALDLLVRHAALVRAAVLADPPAFAFVPEANEPLAAERLALEEALRAGGPAGAVAAWLGRPPSDPDVARAAADHRGFLADYAGRASWSPSRRELRAVGAPVAVVVTDRAPAHVAMAADALLGQLPSGRRADGVADAVGALLAV